MIQDFLLSIDMIKYQIQSNLYVLAIILAIPWSFFFV